MTHRISWRDVFDSNKKWFGHISECMAVVCQTGYEYFTWNGRVYRLDQDKYQDTGWMVSDIG